jgi:hypothetical protein
MFNNNTQTFTLYNYGATTATINSLVFVTVAGTLHQADLSGFDASAVKPYTNPTLTSLSVTIPPSGNVPFTLDYGNSTADLNTYTNILTVYGTINGFPDEASVEASIVVSSVSVPDVVVDGGGSAPGDCSDSGSCSAGGGTGGSSCVIATSLTNLGTWSMAEKMELVRWCEQSLHNTTLGETFRRGYQVLGSRFILPVLFKNGTGLASKYVEWSFTNATSMLRGNRYNKLSIPNSLVWLTAMTLTGVVVSKRYARKSWISLYRKAK